MKKERLFPTNPYSLKKAKKQEADFFVFIAIYFRMFQITFILRLFDYLQ